MTYIIVEIPWCLLSAEEQNKTDCNLCFVLFLTRLKHSEVFDFKLQAHKPFVYNILLLLFLKSFHEP